MTPFPISPLPDSPHAVHEPELSSHGATVSLSVSLFHCCKTFSSVCEASPLLRCIACKQTSTQRNPVNGSKFSFECFFFCIRLLSIYNACQSNAQTCKPYHDHKLFVRLSMLLLYVDQKTLLKRNLQNLHFPIESY